MGGPLRPCVYLALLWRYGTSKYMYTDTQTDTRNDGQNDQSHNLLQCSLRLHLAEIIDCE